MNQIFEKISLGKIMPFFALKINTSHTCTQDDVNNNKNGCTLANDLGYLQVSPDYQWIKMKTITTKPIGNSSSSSSQYPSAMSQPNNYSEDISWIIDDKTNNGSVICSDWKTGGSVPPGFGGECGACVPKAVSPKPYTAIGSDGQPPVCTDRITAINSSNDMKEVKKPWYSLPTLIAPNKINQENDPRGQCPTSQTYG